MRSERDENADDVPANEAAADDHADESGDCDRLRVERRQSEGANRDECIC